MWFDGSNQGKSLFHFPPVCSSPGAWLTSPKVESGLCFPESLAGAAALGHGLGLLLEMLIERHVGIIKVIAAYPGLSH